MSDPHGHLPVLTDSLLELLEPLEGELLLDCTLGRGGHAAAIAARLGPSGRIVGVDLDGANLAYASARLAPLGPAFRGVHAGFVEAPADLESAGEAADLVIADLGFSSNQMDDPDRGFSFRAPGPLDMRLDPSSPRTAADLVAEMSERELAEVIHRLGEEPLSRRIARKIAQRRLTEPIRTTTDLAELVQEAYGPRARSSRLHPATRTFMALRIALNDELNALSHLLESVARAATPGTSSTWLAPGARVGVISFHSLEDRLVKHAFVAMANRGIARILTRKPVVAGADEIAQNPRARSAKLRVARIGNSD